MPPAQIEASIDSAASRRASSPDSSRPTVARDRAAAGRSDSAGDCPLSRSACDRALSRPAGDRALSRSACDRALSRSASFGAFPATTSDVAGSAVYAGVVPLPQPTTTPKRSNETPYERRREGRIQTSHLSWRPAYANCNARATWFAGPHRAGSQITIRWCFASTSFSGVPVKILQVASHYAPTLGGMETVLQDLSEGLLAAGDQVTVLCSSPSRRGADEIMCGVHVLRSPSLGKLLSQPLTPFLPTTLRRLYRLFDLVHLHMPNPLAEAAVAALPRGVPIVVTYHADVIRQKVLKPFYGPIRRAVLKRSRGIVVPTENHIRYSEVLPAFADKCTVVPFGISRPRYLMTTASRARARELRERHGRFVLFVGRLVYYKGLPQLIESMCDVDPTLGGLVIVGDGPLRGEVEAKIASLQVQSRVTLAGAVSQAELNAYLEACQLVVLPSISRSEGFGMTQLEGMMFGKPLVTTRLPSGVQLVNVDGQTGLQVPPLDARALSGAFTRLLSDDALRVSMGAAALERVESRFSLDEMIRGYREAYRQALA
jgi:glycosyltransferase involved in cell wall biosynthesis